MGTLNSGLGIQASGKSSENPFPGYFKGKCYSRNCAGPLLEHEIYLKTVPRGETIIPFY